ncbi:membrane domain protein [Escherichia coli]|uniref:membrane domain protein n=1 Tax=Escherichia coli TaxID=562 RepID=UPI00266D6FF9|nr:membrane domain protein [Escherichia coli]
MVYILFFVLSINIFPVSASVYIFSAFSLFVFLGGIFIILELEFKENKKLMIIRSVTIAVMPIIYLFTSSYASSLFLSLSNLNITLTPWVEYFWKGMAFMLLFFMLMQLIIYFAFLTLVTKLNVYRLFILAGAFIVSTILVAFASKNVEGISYYVLKSTIDFEWRNQIKCGQLNISRSNEKYFGFNTDKYTVFYSNREGKWGFDELKCKKGSDRRDAYSIENVSEYNVPGWLK